MPFPSCRQSRSPVISGVILGKYHHGLLLIAGQKKTAALQYKVLFHFGFISFRHVRAAWMKGINGEPDGKFNSPTRAFWKALMGVIQIP